MSFTNFKATNGKILAFLKAGGNITANQAKEKFGITNVSARISELRKAGYPIYSNTRTTNNGRSIRVYELGTPTRRVVAAGQLVLSDPYFKTLVENELTANLGLV